MPSRRVRAAEPWRAITENQTLGAAALEREALSQLAADLQSTPAPLVEIRARQWARGLSRAPIEMAPIPRLGRRLSLLLSAPPVVAGRKGRILGWARRERARSDREMARVSSEVSRRLPRASRLVTISRSSTLRVALSRLPPARRPIAVAALRSDPGGEGELFARELRQAGLLARVHPDEEAEKLLSHPGTILLLGADAVFRDGALLHKVGTRRLARIARRVRVPVIVVTGRSKLLPSRAPRASRPAFDRTPGSWIDELWTDGGALRPVGGRLRPVRTRTAFAASRFGPASERESRRGTARAGSPPGVRPSSARGRPTRARARRPASPPR
jgi:translation initiation factor 2B subunit (eIF-2B alpha/beta/delta family)